MSTQSTATVDEPIADTMHPDAIQTRDCVSAECIDCAQNFPDDDYAYHFDTRGQMVEAINATDWHPSAAGLRCADCAPDAAETGEAPGDVTSVGLDWLDELSCFAIQCTRCHKTLESDCGEAHFPSAAAAAEAALSAHWLVSTHRVWCRTCTALVAGCNTATSTSHEEQYQR